MKGMGLPHRCKGYRKFFTFFPSASLQRDERANKEWTKLARAPRRCWTFWNQSQIFKEFGRWILTRNMWSFTCWTVPGTKPILTNSLQRNIPGWKLLPQYFLRTSAGKDFVVKIVRGHFGERWITTSGTQAIAVCSHSFLHILLLESPLLLCITVLEIGELSV